MPKKMDQPLDYIFIDTSVFQQERFFKETGRVSKLLKLAEDGYIRILLPIITEKEWLKHFREHAELNLRCNEIERKIELLGQNESASKFLREYNSLLDSYDSLENIDKVFKERISHKGVTRINYSFFEDATAEVFDKYFEQNKPFGSGGKAKEFPDAFVLAALEKYAKENKLNRVVIFSLDKDMSGYCSQLLVEESINEYLNSLLKERIPDVDKKEKQRKDIDKLFNYIGAAKPEFESVLKKHIEQYLSETDLYNSHFCYADIEDVSNLKFSLDITAKDMDILSVSDDIIEAVCFPEIDGTVLVTHFSEEDSVWDSEEKEWFYESYKTTEVVISSYLPVVVRMERNELDMGQDPNVEIVDIDYRPLQSSLDDENY